MDTGRTDEFRTDAVRVALTSGLSPRQVADDLGVGLSRLNKRVAHPGGYPDGRATGRRDGEGLRQARNPRNCDPAKGAGNPHSQARDPLVKLGAMTTA